MKWGDFNEKMFYMIPHLYRLRKKGYFFLVFLTPKPSVGGEISWVSRPNHETWQVRFYLLSCQRKCYFDNPWSILTTDESNNKQTIVS